MREWYKKHPNYHKEQYQKHHTKYLERQRKRREKRTPDEKSRWYRNHKMENYLYSKKSFSKSILLLRKIIGDSCFICGISADSGKRMVYHEKTGKKHPCSKKYYKEHPTDFIPLCNKHHRTLHWFAEADMKKILDLVRLMGYEI